MSVAVPLDVLRLRERPGGFSGGPSNMVSSPRTCGLSSDKRRRRGRGAPVPEIVHELGSLGEADAAGSQGSGNLSVGMTGIQHASGKLDIGRQDFADHR